MTDTTQATAQDMELQFAGPEGLAEQILALRGEMQELLALRTEVEQLRAEVVRLDADLDESRRLNLRAAELLDVVYEELGTRRTPSEEAP
jgi:cell shape-determining protein MreC